MDRLRLVYLLAPIADAFSFEFEFIALLHEPIEDDDFVSLLGLARVL